MRAVVQRVGRADVVIGGKIISQIGKGLLILLGIEDIDNIEDIEWLCSKIAKLRIFNDKNGLMDYSVNDINGELMVVSQFTLLANTKKGNRPSYIKASKPSIAMPLYEKFVKQLSGKCNNDVKTGEFGAMMEVGLVNDGPVTIIIDSKNKDF